jgi:hypothetical protein
MLATLVVLLRTLGLRCTGHRAIALENVALRQQFSIFRRTVMRPHFRTSDRVFLGPARQGVAGLANGLDRRAARHCRALASPMTPAPLDATLNSNTGC